MVPPGSLAGSLASAVSCLADTPIREVARLKKESTEPVVVQRDGAVVGVIGENELLECML
jgi:glycine betaine/proline transport system ATP-binding protein